MLYFSPFMNIRPINIFWKMFRFTNLSLPCIMLFMLFFLWVIFLITSIKVVLFVEYIMHIFISHMFLCCGVLVLVHHIYNKELNYYYRYYYTTLYCSHTLPYTVFILLLPSVWKNREWTETEPLLLLLLLLYYYCLLSPLWNVFTTRYLKQSMFLGYCVAAIL
jgi:hypothetical protein